MRFLLIFFIVFALIPGVNAVWEADNSINASLPEIDRGHPSIFLMDGTRYMISGNSNGTFLGFNWTGTAWQADNNINASLPDVGGGVQTKPNVFFADGTPYMIVGIEDGTFLGFNWTGTAWQADNNINASLPDVGSEASPSVFFRDGTRYMIVGCDDGDLFGFNWTGTAWQADNNINASLPDVGRDSKPNVFFKDGFWYAIVAETTGNNGFNWTGTAWQADSAIIEQLISTTHASPFIFKMDGPLYLIMGSALGLDPDIMFGFLWNETPNPVTPTINSPNGVTTNATIILNATSTDSNVNFYWFNNSEFLISSETPINDTQLVGAWHLGEGNGNFWIENTNLTGDYSGSGNDGEVVNAEYVRGRFEKGLEFDGTASYIDINDSASLQIAGNTTITFWVNFNSVSATARLVSKADGGGTNYDALLSSSKIRFTDGSATPISNTVLNISTWYYAAIVIDSGVSTTFYLDGEQDGSPGASTITPNDADLIIGKFYTDTQYFNGTIDEIRIYNRTLSATEISDEYHLAFGFFNWTHRGVEDLYSMAVQTSDSYTNSTQATSQIIFGTPPILQYIPETPANATVRVLNWVTVNVSADENISSGVLDFNGTNTTMTCSYVNESFTNCVGNATSLSDGDYIYRVFMNNTVTLLNVTPDREITINAIAPPINIFTPENITYNDTNIFFLANSTAVDEDTFLYWISIDGVNITQNQTYFENTHISIKDFLSINKAFEIHAWVNDTSGNQNITSVIFTIDVTNQTNITIEPTTPPSGGDGGYDVDLNFTTDITAATTVGGYEPFTIMANLFVTDASVTFGTPVIRFTESNVVVGSFNLHYVRGSNNNITYKRTVALPPGVYSYYIETEASNGVSYFSSDHFINVRVPTAENITGMVLPSKAFFGLLVTFTDETTPKSHSRVTQSDGIYISGTALNVNGTVSNVTLFILDEQGATVLSTTALDSVNNGNNTWSLFGFSSLPEDITRITIQLGVIDTGGRAAYSVSRKLIVLPENPEGIIKDSVFPFLNPFGDDGEGEGGLSPGRIFAATLIMVVLIGGLYASGAGTLPAVAFSIMTSIEFATFGIIPTWVSILGLVLLGMIMMRSVLAMWLRR